MSENERSVETPEKVVESSVEERRAKWEREKMTRRQSLARFGFLAGAAAVAALTADDLTRLVGKELQKRAESGKVVEQVAKEFQAAGVSFATDPVTVAPTTPPPDCWTAPCLNACNNAGQMGFCLQCCQCVKNCNCIENIPASIRYPEPAGIDCANPANAAALVCHEYHRRLSACDDKAQSCSDDCRKIPPPPTPTPVPTPTPTPKPVATPTTTPATPIPETNL